MKKSLIKIICVAMCLAVLVTTSAIGASAASNTVIIKNNNKYEHYYMSTSYATVRSQQVETPGLYRDSIASGSFTVSQSDTISFSLSGTLSSSFSTGFASVGATLGVSNTVSKTVSAGTTITLAPTAPYGIYYCYLYLPQKKTYFRVQTSSLYYSDWKTVYSKTYTYAPSKYDEYLRVIKKSDI